MNDDETNRLITGGFQKLSEILVYWHRLVGKAYVAVATSEPVTVPAFARDADATYFSRQRHFVQDGQPMVTVVTWRGWSKVLALCENDLFDVGDAQPLVVRPCYPNQPRLLVAETLPDGFRYSFLREVRPEATDLLRVR